MGKRLFTPGSARFGVTALGIALALAGTSMAASVAAQSDPATSPTTAATAAPAAAASPAAAPDEAALKAGRQLFEDWSCGSCHELADAGANGHVGPSFDGDANLSKDYIVNRVTNGQGAMPSFGGLMTDKEIGTVADYLLAAAQK